jgi:hypothetical protein
MGEIAEMAIGTTGMITEAKEAIALAVAEISTVGLIDL